MVDAPFDIRGSFAEIAKRRADTDADMHGKIEYMANAIVEIAML